MDTTPSRTSQSIAALRAQFDYDRTLPSNVAEHGREHKNSISVADVSYPSSPNRTTRAYLVAPSGEGSFAGVIFVHPAPGDRDTFLDEAIILAEHGAIALVVDAAWAQGEGWGQALIQPEQARTEFTNIVMDL